MASFDVGIFRFNLDKLTWFDPTNFNKLILTTKSLDLQLRLGG